jgi:cellulose synthase/poly-beta-1,6-N-acetylglucosamine synthase-like glycosyltransferase
MRPVLIATVILAAAATVSTRSSVAGRTGVAAHAPRTFAVGASDLDLQAAINNASPGDTIMLTPGATYTGPFTLPQKAGDAWIEIRPSPLERGLPPPGNRVQPFDTRAMSKLVAASGSVITADPGAHHYHLMGLEITSSPGANLVNLIDLGSSAATPAETPHDFQIDRCYVHGDPAVGARRGIALNSASTTIADSYFSDFKEVGVDSQAIAGWNGPGPFVVTNNYLEGAGENLLFGGADPSIPNLVPANIEITRNLFSKPLTWQVGNRLYGGTEWQVKNLLELKNAEHVKIDGNILQYNWPEAQNGFAVLFTVRNQDGHAPWSTVTDIQFTNNVVQHVAAGVNILGHDDNNQSAPAQNIQISNNLFLDVGGTWSFGRLFQLLNGANDITISHNTAIQTESILLADEQPDQGFVFKGNITPHNQYGVIGAGTGIGTSSLDVWFPGAVFQGNVIPGGQSSNYPGGNFFPNKLSDVGLSATTGFNVGLLPTSPFRGKAGDGSDPGVNLAALTKALGLQATSRSSGGETGAVIALWLFWGSLGLLGYVYFGYGAVAWLETRLRWRTRAARPLRERPFVTAIVVACNEGARIARRIENLLSLEYPRDRIEILIASDGSTDDTVEIARRYEPRVRVIAYPMRRGKAAVLDDVIPLAHGEIVVLSDARQVFARDAIGALVAPFADPRVGAVSGELMLRSRGADGEAAGAAVYWTYEKRLRAWESSIDSTMGVTGAIYAMRRNLFEPFPPDTILDDVVIPAHIVRRGYRVLFEPRAIAYDDVAASPRDEFIRKVRTIAGTFQFFAREPWTLNPFQNRIWLQTMSHKGLRLVLPLAYATVLVANVFLVSVAPLYLWTMVLQLAFYGSAAAAAVSPSLRRHVKAMVVPHMLCLLSWATIVAFVRYLTGVQTVRWDRPSTS